MRLTLLVILVLLLIGAAGCTGTGGATTKVNVQAGDYACTDSESGVDQFVIGTVSGVDANGAFEKEDRCVGSWHVIDYYCEGVLLANQNFRCDNGCENGVCE